MELWSPCSKSRIKSTPVTHLLHLSDLVMRMEANHRRVTGWPLRRFLKQHVQLKPMSNAGDYMTLLPPCNVANLWHLQWPGSVGNPYDLVRIGAHLWPPPSGNLFSDNDTLLRNKAERRKAKPLARPEERIGPEASDVSGNRNPDGWWHLFIHFGRNGRKVLTSNAFKQTALDRCCVVGLAAGAPQNPLCTTL